MYDDAWMPNMQRITWNGIALHGGPLPGYAASHGCVRMPFDFAEKLFDKTRIGMRVIISPNDAEPVEFSHPALFVPNAEAIAAAPARAEALAREAAEAAKTADEAKKAAATAARETASLDGVAAQAGRAQDPRRRRARLRRQGARRRQDRPGQGAGRGPQAEGRRQGRGPGTQLDAAKADAKSKLDAAARKDAAKAAAAKKADTAKAASEAKLALEPVSVYISRATQKLYVRRNTHKPAPDGGGEVFDSTIEVPVTIRDPDKPIGTHVFTAMARNDAGLRWSAVTIDNGDDAKDALDRITIPQEVLDRIAPTALPRSSIIISDEPLSAETNYRTEFVAVLNNQPQGGFITRKPTPAADVARRQRQRRRRRRLRLVFPQFGRPPTVNPSIRAGSSATRTIVRCNPAGGKTRHRRARRPRSSLSVICRSRCEAPPGFARLRRAAIRPPLRRARRRPQQLPKRIKRPERRQLKAHQMSLAQRQFFKHLMGFGDIGDVQYEHHAVPSLKREPLVDLAVQIELYGLADFRRQDRAYARPMQQVPWIPGSREVDASKQKIGARF